VKNRSEIPVRNNRNQDNRSKQRRENEPAEKRPNTKQMHASVFASFYFPSKDVVIAVFNNMQTLKFKPQLTVYVFRCRQSSKRTSWETEAHFSRVIGRYRSILFVSVFQGSLEVAIIMIDGSEKSNRQLGFELQSSHVIENRNKVSILFHVTSNYCCLGSVTEKTP